MLHQWNPPKPRWLMHSRHGLLSPPSVLSSSCITLDFLFLSLSESRSQFALSAGNFAKRLHVFVSRVCVCVCLHAFMCGKPAEAASQGEASECNAGLTWWQMKIKRLLLKMGGFCDPMRPMSACATRRARNGEKGGRQRGGRACRGTGSPGQCFWLDVWGR